MTAKNKSRKGNKKQRKINWFGIVAILVILIFVFVYVFSNMPMWGEKPQVKQTKSGMLKQPFNIEGTLRFAGHDNNTVARFYVEIADDEYSREKGMMFKHFIPDTVGMLFIFPEEDHRFFWMKNTPSSLDIIYADAEFNIVSIHENTPPKSEESIPSGDKAKYVIELKAGSVARYGITKKHTFSYQQLDQPLE